MIYAGRVITYNHNLLTFHCLCVYLVGQFCNCFQWKATLARDNPRSTLVSKTLPQPLFTDFSQTLKKHAVLLHRRRQSLWLIRSRICAATARKHRLLVATPLFPAPLGWVTWNQSPVRVGNGWRRDESVSFLSVDNSLQMARGHPRNQTVWTRVYKVRVNTVWVGQMRWTRAGARLFKKKTSLEIKCIVYFSPRPLIKCPLYIPLHFFLQSSLFIFRRSYRTKTHKNYPQPQLAGGVPSYRSSGLNDDQQWW